MVTLRPEGPADAEFLYSVYASTRADEMALVDWSPEQKDAFVRMQFNAQRSYYRSQYPQAENDLILQDGKPAGRIIINRSTGEILLVDLALLPEYRNLGIGTGLIRSLQQEAGRSGFLIRLHVELFNPALRLYEHLGFSRTGAAGIYHEMEWRPAGSADGRYGKISDQA